MHQTDRPIWFHVGVGALALGWLLPNHYHPWPSFHADAWMAALLLVVAFVFVLSARVPMPLGPDAVLVALLCALPWVQHWAGLLPYFGQAWISSGYLLGFFLAVALGRAWADQRGDELMDALMWAVVLAAGASVFLQLYLWLGLGQGNELASWHIGGDPRRPAGNLAQPNQLATLLVWAMVSLFWFYQKRQLSAPVVCAALVFLMVGLVLTRSRAGWLEVTCLCVFLWLWRARWRARAVPAVATALYLLFLCLPYALRWLHQMLLLSDANGFYMRPLVDGNESRFVIWQLFWDAAWARPWTGYGLTDVFPAQFAVAASHPAIGVAFSSAHNIVLDLLLWFGFPVGSLVTGFGVAFVGWALLRARSAQQSILLMFLVAMGVHSMLELPLHYAYFLLPTGLILGALISSLRGKVLLLVPWQAMLGVLFLSATALTLTVVDYLTIERDHLNARYALARVGKLVVEDSGRVGILDQLRARVQLMEADVDEAMTSDAIERHMRAALYGPGVGPMFRLAHILAVNGRGAEAIEWLNWACYLAPKNECEQVRLAWVLEGKRNPKLAQVMWPDPPALD